MALLPCLCSDTGPEESTVPASLDISRSALLPLLGPDIVLGTGGTTGSKTVLLLPEFIFSRTGADRSQKSWLGSPGP